MQEQATKAAERMRRLRSTPEGRARSLADNRARSELARRHRDEYDKLRADYLAAEMERLAGR